MKTDKIETSAVVEATPGPAIDKDDTENIKILKY